MNAIIACADVIAFVPLADTQVDDARRSPSPRRAVI